MGAMSVYLTNNIINHIFSSSTYEKPSTIAVALCHSPVSAEATGATMPELALSGSYGRVRLNPDPTNWVSSGAGLVSNGVAVRFLAASDEWEGGVSHVAIMDSVQYGAGNVLFSGPIETPKTINQGEILSFSPGELTIQVG